MISYNYLRLKRLIMDTDEYLYYRGPNNDLNSIAQHVRHLMVVELHWIFRLQGKPIPNEMIERYGPMYDEEGKLPLVFNMKLEDLITEYDEIQLKLKLICKQFKDEDLETQIPFENGNKATIKWGIWHIADHSRHHYSNIAFLKKLYKLSN
ncbi:DinB family protein [Cohnella luojiensis]|uniref:DinB family protein n=2 Tax=Cohnella luojiensis TaxID=652876 RepID=A0A4Y8LPF6_9BACL|nr:DinB family protein [Cohnella luojiensis]